MQLTDLLCFNPYFTGSNSGRNTGCLVSEYNSGFNPYFTGSNSGSAHGWRGVMAIQAFQSLFYWK